MLLPLEVDLLAKHLRVEELPDVLARDLIVRVHVDGGEPPLQRRGAPALVEQLDPLGEGVPLERRGRLRRRHPRWRQAPDLVLQLLNRVLTADAEAAGQLVADDAVLVEQPAGRKRTDAVESGEDRLTVDQVDEGGVGFVDVRLRDWCALSVEGDGDELEVVAAVALVELLPDRQVVPADSPARPAKQDDALAAQIAQRDGCAIKRRQGEVRGGASVLHRILRDQVGNLAGAGAIVGQGLTARRRRRMASLP